MSSPETAREIAIEFLARQLAEKSEHLDPSDGAGWEDYSDNEKEFYRQLVKWLLAHRAELLTALGLGERPSVCG